ncbi:Zn-dependent hydrolase [Turicimonas muris]|uniref:Zn-dependent hydrolase n=1 Tax=Turicimonas muris TaxID=1796652 RepID=UPI0025AEEC82|nr:Zn-dependent hydrolase [Turicimonas muris]
MPSEFQKKSSEFAKKCFDDIREMSKDGQGVSRQGYSPVETQVLEYFKKIGNELNLEISTDKAGNVWMTIPGKNRNLPALVSGSHVDSVPQGGNYDGLAGVVAALTVARWMREINYVPERDYTVLMMRMEESSWFGKCYVGSLGMTGQLTEQDLALKHRSTGKTLKETIKACGFNPDDLTTGVPVVDLAKMAAFIELHIEQGPTLDSSDTRVGIVTGIRGNFRHKTIKCIGETAHSGAVDKQFRHDAVLAMAELAYKMDCLWDDWLKDDKDLVFTIGVVHTAATSAIAIVPGEVTFCCDIRSLHRETLEQFHALLLQQAEEIGKKRGVKFEFDKTIISEPLAIHENLMNHLDKSAREAGLNVRKLPSGAGHDSVIFGNLGIPAAMIFVANQDGSHNPHEKMKLEDFIQGADALWNAVKNFPIEGIK